MYHLSRVVGSPVNVNDAPVICIETRALLLSNNNSRIIPRSGSSAIGTRKDAQTVALTVKL